LGISTVSEKKKGGPNRDVFIWFLNPGKCQDMDVFRKGAHSTQGLLLGYRTKKERNGFASSIESGSYRAGGAGQTEKKRRLSPSIRMGAGRFTFGKCQSDARRERLSGPQDCDFGEIKSREPVKEGLWYSSYEGNVVIAGRREGWGPKKRVIL